MAVIMVIIMVGVMMIMLTGYDGDGGCDDDDLHVCSVPGYWKRSMGYIAT